MQKNPHIVYFVYCEVVENKIVDNRPQVQILNPLQVITLKYIPGQYSYTVSFAIQGVDIEQVNKLRATLKDGHGNIVSDTGDIFLPALEPTPENLFDAKLPKEYRGLQMNFDFRNVEFKNEGVYISEVFWNETILGEYPIDVIKIS